MGADPRAPNPAVPPHADLNAVRVLLAESPQRSRAAMAELRFGSAGQHSRHPTPLPADQRSPHRVNAPPNRMKPPSTKPVFDRALTESQGEQLSTTDHSMLPSRHFPSQPTGRFHPLPRHNEDKDGNDLDSPPSRLALPGRPRLTCRTLR